MVVPKKFFAGGDDIKIERLSFLREHDGDIITCDCYVEIIKDRPLVWKRIIDYYYDFVKVSNGYERVGVRGRRVGMPDFISETILALIMKNTYRKFKNGRVSPKRSYDLVSFVGEDKSCLIDSKAAQGRVRLDSFSPKNTPDIYALLRFFKDGCYYLHFLSSEKVLNYFVNKKQSFLDQQGQERRPRFDGEKLVVDQKPFLKGNINDKLIDTIDPKDIFDFEKNKKLIQQADLFRDFDF